MQQRRPKNFGTQSIDSLKLSKAFSKADAGFVCYATSLFGEASDVVVYTLTAHFWHHGYFHQLKSAKVVFDRTPWDLGRTPGTRGRQ
jgi:hypothetical protein